MAAKLSPNAEDILKHLRAQADEQGRGRVTLRELERVALCGARAATSALYELPAAGLVRSLDFAGDSVLYQIKREDVG